MKHVTQTNELDWKISMKHMKDWKPTKTMNPDENHTKWISKPSENKKIKRMKHKKLPEMNEKKQKDEKVSENENGETKSETYESLINGILRSVWGIEMKHGIWQWNHGNHIEKDRIIVMDPKMDNETCNTEK